MKANCASDASCPEGSLCASYTYLPGCDMPALACQTAADRCATDADCSLVERCTLNGAGARVCQQLGCVEGRPFLVAGQERVASLSSHGEFLGRLAVTDVAELASGVRAHLAKSWARVALMEHASIAAFARFTLELLSFAAPAELVASSAQAMADEVEHARGAFSLASRYEREAVGPGPLAVQDSLAEIELESSVLTTFLEGCIGETLAALQAREALILASDPAVRAFLARVAEDEARHAELAWRFVQWALPRCGNELPRRLARALDSELSVDSAPSAGEERWQRELHAHGVLTARERALIRRTALRDVVATCLRALLESSHSDTGARCAIATA
jgi:hypothetical protein